MKGCPPLEVFVNFWDFPFSCEPSEDRFRAVACKERCALASTLLLADLEVTDGEGDLDDVLGDSGVKKSSSSSSVGDPGSGIAARKAAAASCPKSSNRPLERGVSSTAAGCQHRILNTN